jgi:two-component system, NtrC family, sensor kinase
MIPSLLRSSMRFKLIVSLLSIVFLMGTLSLIIGINVINRTVVREGTDSVRNALAATSELYEEEIGSRARIVEYLAKTAEIVRATANKDRQFLFDKLAQIKSEFGFDIVNVVNPDGSILVRANNFDAWGDSVAHYRYIQWVMRNREPASGTGILGNENIRNESRALAERTIIQVVPTALARPRESRVEDRALVMKAASPIVEDGQMIGILYAAILLNNNAQFIDRFKRLVFKEEKIGDREVGASTLFLGDMRVSTTVVDRTGARAIGTLVSKEVYRKVFEEGQTWLGPAFVIDRWYLSGYSPLRDIDGRVQGMLYVGILKDKSDAALRRTTLLFLLVIVLTTLLAVGLLVWLINVYTRPVKRIITASADIAAGHYHPLEIHPRDDADARNISTAFNSMVAAIEERDRMLQERTEQTILRSEKLASLGRLASGIAHEINNPLTGVLTFSSLLLGDLRGTKYEDDLKVIRDETLRCRTIVRGILDFARENEPSISAADIHAVLDETLQILEKNVHFQNVDIVREYARDLPPVPCDVHQMKQVIGNLAVNAADAMPQGGRLTISTALDAERNEAVIRVADTGVGISEAHMSKLFEPFFTTKDQGKGTGLGLAVVYGIIQRHGGTIDVKSAVGAGTEFTVRLPLAAKR